MTAAGDVYRTGLKFLEAADQTHRRYTVTSPDEQEPQTYERRIPLGYDKQTGELVEYSVDYHDRLGVFGTTGSGKTTFCKAILSRLFQGGMKVLHAADIKNDFADIDNEPGVSKRLRDAAGFAPGEQRTPIPVQLSMPKFLAEEYPGTVPYYLNQFTLGFQDISMADLEYLIATNSTRQDVVLTRVMNRVEMQGMSFPRLKEEVDAEDCPQNVKLALKSSIESLEQNQILSRRFRKDPLSPLRDGHVSVLALENWDRFKRSGLERVELYIGVTLRRLKEALRDGEMQGPVMVFIDEAHAFCPAGEQSISKKELVDLVDLGRAYKVPMMFSTQHPSQIPNPEDSDRYDVLGSINHFFLAPNLSETDWKQCLKASGLWRTHMNQDTWRNRFERMDQYDFLYIDKEQSTWRIIEPLAPLCAHTG